MVCLQGIVTIYNFQKHRSIGAPGWKVGWTWARKEVIWSMIGAQVTNQGDCSKFKGNVPHSCKKNPTIIDLKPGTPYNQQIGDCCRGGVLDSWSGKDDSRRSKSAFQIAVGVSVTGTTNKTVKMPKMFIFKAPGGGYSCGPAKIVRPTRFYTADRRRVTQAISKIFNNASSLCFLHFTLIWIYV